MLFDTSVVQSSSTHVFALFFVAWLTAETPVIFFTFSLVRFRLSGEGPDSCKDSESSHSYGVGSGKVRREKLGGRSSAGGAQFLILTPPGPPPREGPESLEEVQRAYQE